ncbi:MAG: hypothetical protein ACLRP3_13370 [Escherichia sp.]
MGNKGDDRAFSADEHFYNNVLLPAGGGERVLSSPVDKIEPFREWDAHLYSSLHSASTSKRKKLKLLNDLFTHYPVTPVPPMKLQHSSSGRDYYSGFA